MLFSAMNKRQKKGYWSPNMTQPWNSWLNNRQSCCWYFIIKLKGAGLPKGGPCCASRPAISSSLLWFLYGISSKTWGGRASFAEQVLKTESSNWGFLTLPKEKITTQGTELKSYRITASSTAAAHLWLFTATLNIHRVVPKKREWGTSRTTELVLHQRRFRLDIRRKVFWKRIFNFAKIFQ